MKKIFALLICLILLPNTVLAKENDIYMFYSNTCIHCENAKKYFNTLFKDHPNLKIYLFEVTDDTPNQKLFKKISKKIKYNESSVPLIIIGNEHYVGYSSESNDVILEALKSEPNDIMHEYITDGNYTLLTKNKKKTVINKYYINKKAVLVGITSIIISIIIVIPILIITKKKIEH